jgi:hypothetical protein
MTPVCGAHRGASTSAAPFHSRDPKAAAATVANQTRLATQELRGYAHQVLEIANQATRPPSSRFEPGPDPDPSPIHA